MESNCNVRESAENVELAGAPCLIFKNFQFISQKVSRYFSQPLKTALFAAHTHC